MVMRKTSSNSEATLTALNGNLKLGYHRETLSGPDKRRLRRFGEPLFKKDLGAPSSNTLAPMEKFSA